MYRNATKNAMKHVTVAKTNPMKGPDRRHAILKQNCEKARPTEPYKGQDHRPERSSSNHHIVKQRSPTTLMTIYLPVFQRERMRELILHLARPTQQSEWHQTQRLVNLVHIIDFTTYQRLGDPITGARYMKAPSGPVPVEISELKETMRQDGDIQNAWTHSENLPVEWLAANRQPNMKVF